MPRVSFDEGLRQLIESITAPMKTIDIICPVYREEDVIGVFHKRLAAVVEAAHPIVTGYVSSMWWTRRLTGPKPYCAMSAHAMLA